MISTEARQGNDRSYDVILISGDYWADHPQSGVGVIARVLDSKGYSVGIIEKPDWEQVNHFLRLGLPRLYFGITSGAIDTMLVNYTPLMKRRAEDPYYPYDSGIPDRATVVYSQKVREAQKKYWLAHDRDPEKERRPIVLGGVEASLRRFTHFDYWDNRVRRPLLFDAKADILVYGPGEHQVVEIAHRLEKHASLDGIAGTCIIRDTLPTTQPPVELLPSYESVIKDKKAFCRMQLGFSNEKNLVQPVGKKFLIQNAMYPYTPADLDWLYSLPFSYNVPEEFNEFKMAQFSIITHRGCFGNCNFCSIALHQGRRIISRSKESVLAEIRKMKVHPDFKGFISDVGGPSANMYGMDCAIACEKNDCLDCPNLNKSHAANTDLLKSARDEPGIKKVLVRSGIRYDLAIDADEYLEELINHHVAGTLKIAPEHFSPRVLHLMNKDSGCFDTFLEKFHRINTNPKQELRHYLMTAHPGSTMDDVEILRKKMLELKNIENVQIFTPSPMSISTCMYCTGLNPFTLEPVYVPYSYNEKKRQKNVLFETGSGSGDESGQDRD